MMDKGQLYRSLPKVDILLENDGLKRLAGTYGHETVLVEARAALSDLRRLIDRCETEKDGQAVLKAVEDLTGEIERRIRLLWTPRVKKVINGTGTILHTNLGRAPLSETAAGKLSAIVSGYCNLEYDLEAGKRGERYSHFEDLICRLTGAEAAIVVNNNAAAVMLILSSLAKGGEVIVSRGELVEIGGKFRVPDVMEQSGAHLVEVGTTNKTHLSDYKAAVTEKTKAILKVHTSNYRIVGFTESVPVSELTEAACDFGIPVIEDLGSGVFIDLEKYGLPHEPTVQESISAGADVVCFSGDKLLGGPQAGVIIGKKTYIDLMKKNQLTRALRVDKCTVAALEMVLMEYLNRETVAERLPVLRMITESYKSTQERAVSLVMRLGEEDLKASVTAEACASEVGGGSFPMTEIASTAVVIKPYAMSSAALESAMRALDVPIICRVAKDTVRLDVRTISETDTEIIIEELKGVLG